MGLINPSGDENPTYRENSPPTKYLTIVWQSAPCLQAYYHSKTGDAYRKHHHCTAVGHA